VRVAEEKIQKEQYIVSRMTAEFSSQTADQSRIGSETCKTTSSYSVTFE
jgi:hypothetical protein